MRNMNNTPPVEREQAILLARAGWLEVLDDIHGGLCHDLNGRVSSLEGLLQILRLDGSDDTPVVSYIESESARLADTVKILRSLSGKPDAPAEPIQANDLAERALVLHRRHRGLEVQETRLEVAQGLTPFRGSPPRMLRVLLVLLSRAGRAARDAGVKRLVLSTSDVDGGPAFTVRWEAGDVAWDHDGLQDVAQPLERIVATDGGTLQWAPGEATLAFPPMAAGGA